LGPSSHPSSAHAGHVVGMHANGLLTFPSGDLAELEGLTEAEQARLGHMEYFNNELSAYAAIQGPGHRR
jgi:epoxide hydrolase